MSKATVVPVYFHLDFIPIPEFPSIQFNKDLTEQLLHGKPCRGAGDKPMQKTDTEPRRCRPVGEILKAGAASLSFHKSLNQYSEKETDLPKVTQHRTGEGQDRSSGLWTGAPLSPPFPHLSPALSTPLPFRTHGSISRNFAWS